MLAPRTLGKSAPPPVPPLARARPSAPPPTPGMPPPVPPPLPVKIEAKVPPRTATPTVQETPGLAPRVDVRRTSIPPVAGFDTSAGRQRWLVILGILVAILAAAITIALVR
jgi:hypothetical protein